MREFLDEFKHLEKICSEMYGKQHGITQYIDDMEETSSYLANSIPGFFDDLKHLKRVRHIRNNMVHESGYDEDYTQDDIIFLRAFYNRIMNRLDPIAERQKLQDKKKPKETKKNPHSSDYMSDIVFDNAQSHRSTFTFAFKVLVGIVLLTLALGGVACVLGILSLF